MTEECVYVHHSVEVKYRRSIDFLGGHSNVRSCVTVDYYFVQMFAEECQLRAEGAALHSCSC